MSSVIINHIRGNKLFADVDIESLQLNEKDFDFTSVEQGKFIFRKGDLANRVFLLAYGKVVLFSGSDKFELNDNSFFGAEVLNSETYQFSAVAKDSSLLLTMTKEQATSLVEKNRELKEHLTNWREFAVSKNVEDEPENEIEENDDLFLTDIETELSFEESDFLSENNLDREDTGKDNLEVAELIASVYFEPAKKLSAALQKLKDGEDETAKESAAAELAGLIQTIEDASNNAKRFSLNNNELEFNKVNLSAFFSELAESIAERFSAAPELHVPEECSLNLSKDDFFEAIKQVVINSFESIDEEGTVKISVTCSGDYAEILVEDNGAGIPEESINDIFEPFFSYGKQNNIGLGLAIADEIISAHSGKIAVKKTTVDGTVFSILLPLPE
jgi:signal transduction histidine kinase